MRFKEIENKTKELQNKRYYRSNVLNQNKGLTDFIKELEKQANEKNIYFDIVGGSPKLVIPYKTDNWNKNSVYFENDQEVLFVGYVGFIYDNFYYYIQIDDNPYFNHYIEKIPLLKDENEFYFNKSYYLDDINNLYDNITIEELFGYNKTCRTKIKDNLINIFNNCKISTAYNDNRWPVNYKRYINKDKKIYFNI
jgi:hypothetical protein